jgi:hypothetical protein
LILASAALAAEPPPPADAPGLAEGLMAPSRGRREAAESRARELARTDPAGLAKIWSRLDARGRSGLVRALASAGTSHAARVAMKMAATAEAGVFRALLDGLAAGGKRALFADAPEGLPRHRKAALAELRLRWRVEEELVRLKSPAGQTGHYTGQFGRVRKIGRRALPILYDIVRDRAHPLSGEGAAGPYAYLHPEMVRFGRRELRNMVAIGIAEVVERDDVEWKVRLLQLFDSYWELDRNHYAYDYLHDGLAPNLAYALHDLGIRDPGRKLLAHLEWQVEYGRQLDRLSAIWELGYANIRLGNFEEGERWYETIIDYWSISRHVAAYNLACNFSMRAMQEPRQADRFKRLALDWLERAVHEYNWHDWPWMEADGDLNFIRREPRYQAVLAHLKRKYPDRRRGKIAKQLEEFLKDAPGVKR